MASQVIENGDVSKEETAPTNLDNHTDTAHSEIDVHQQPDLEKSTSAKPPAPTGGLPPPPNGGLIAWLQVTAGFMLFFNTWGMISTFGVFQTYYESGELFKASSSNISWIGSIQCFFIQFTGLVAGPIYDRGYLRRLLLTGSFMIVFGLMMLSLCKEF